MFRMLHLPACLFYILLQLATIPIQYIAKGLKAYGINQNKRVSKPVSVIEL